MSTATHYVMRHGYEGPCCLDCAAAVGGERRDLQPGEGGYGKPCWSCEEMTRDAERERIEAEENDAQLVRESCLRPGQSYPD